MKYKPTITIFTPAYNRASLLPRLYDSLCSQSSKNFIWHIIDDGSIDDTESLIRAYIEDAKISIRFDRVDNGGKHRAVNKAVASADTLLFFIVDSDDYLVDSAVEIIERVWLNSNNEENKLIGLCFRRTYTNGRMIGIPFIEEGLLASMMEITYKHKLNIDRAEVFVTGVLKKFKFDEIENENFITEAIVWNRMSKLESSKLYCSNEAIYYCDYQSDGLTSSFNKLLKKYPQGFIRYYGELLRTPNVWIYPLVVVKATIRLIQSWFYLIIR